MKLLFDQNISHRILNLLPNEYDGSEQVRTVGLYGSSDLEVWNFARDNLFTVVTFDTDFADIAYLRDIPPKIIWLRTGNMTTRKIAELFTTNREIVSRFVTDREYAQVACLELE